MLLGTNKSLKRQHSKKWQANENDYNDSDDEGLVNRGILSLPDNRFNNIDCI